MVAIPKPRGTATVSTMARSAKRATTMTRAILMVSTTKRAKPKGAHGGTVFKEGDFSLEALLSEDGGEPRLRIWLFDKDKPLPLNAATVTATVTRPTDEKQKLTFAAEKDSLVSREIVAEPHSFRDQDHCADCHRALHVRDEQGRRKIELTDAQIKAASISLDNAAKANIKTALLLPGEIRLNEDRTLDVVPRLAGVVESVNASLGQVVKKEASFGGSSRARLLPSNAASCRRPKSA